MATTPKTARKARSRVVTDGPSGSRKKRTPRPYPPLSFPEALAFGKAIQQHAAGNKVRRLVLFDNMKRSAENTAARTLVTASNQYKITKGSYNAEYVELTTDGRIATADGSSPADRLKASFRLAIENNSWFKSLYDTFQDNRWPSTSVIEDHLRTAGLDEEFVAECVATFTVNAKSLGLLKPVAGAERLLTLEHAVEELGSQAEQPGTGAGGAVVSIDAPTRARPPAFTPISSTSLDDVCFYISPIGEPDTDHRKHADLFMEALVIPALAPSGLRLVRADQIGAAGLITAQIIEHIVLSKLVIADLSFHNPNVFYELALRHAVRKPIVQLIRVGDQIPFDLNQFRTIVIDNTNIYTMVPQLETYRTEIGNQIRMALQSTSEGDNPITAFYPDFWKAVAASAAM